MASSLLQGYRSFINLMELLTYAVDSEARSQETHLINKETKRACQHHQAQRRSSSNTPATILPFREDKQEESPDSNVIELFYTLLGVAAFNYLLRQHTIKTIAVISMGVLYCYHVWNAEPPPTPEAGTSITPGNLRAGSDCPQERNCKCLSRELAVEFALEAGVEGKDRREMEDAALAVQIAIEEECKYNKTVAEGAKGKRAERENLCLAGRGGSSGEKVTVEKDVESGWGRERIRRWMTSDMLVEK